MDLCKNGLHLLFELHYLHRVLFNFLFMPILFSRYCLKTHDILLLAPPGAGHFLGELVYSFISRCRYG
jgi:hypothetical protein